MACYALCRACLRPKCQVTQKSPDPYGKHNPAVVGHEEQPIVVSTHF